MGLNWTVFFLSNVTLHILASLWQSNVGVTLAGRWLFPELYIDLTAHTHCHDFPSDTCYYHCRDEIILNYQQVNSKRKLVSPSAYSISTHLCVHLPLDLKLWVGSEMFGSMLEGPFATPPVLASLESHRKCFAWVWGCLLGKHVHLSCTGIASCRGFWPLPQTDAYAGFLLLPYAMAGRRKGTETSVRSCVLDVGGISENCTCRGHSRAPSSCAVN